MVGEAFARHLEYPRRLTGRKRPFAMDPSPAGINVNGCCSYGVNMTSVAFFTALNHYTGSDLGDHRNNLGVGASTGDEKTKE